jgi:hypothetical protein
VPAISVGFQEPSLVFMLGSATVLTDDATAAAEHLARTPGAVAIVDEDAASGFAAAAQARGLALAALDRVSGLNYSNGQRVTLAIFAVHRTP